MRIVVTSYNAKHSGEAPALDTSDPLLHVDVEIGGQTFTIAERDGQLEVRVTGGFLVIEPVSSNVVTIKEGRRR